MVWTGLSDSHHGRGDLADLTPDGDRLFTLLLTFTNTPQRKGRFSRLDAAQLARSRKFPIDLDVALADLLSPDHPQIEEVDGGFQIINSDQYHRAPNLSWQGQAGGNASAAKGRPQENGKHGGRPPKQKPTETNRKPTETNYSPSPSPSPSPSGSNGEGNGEGSNASVVTRRVRPVEDVFRWAEERGFDKLNKRAVKELMLSEDLTAAQTLDLLDEAERRGKAKREEYPHFVSLVRYVTTNHDEHGSIPGSLAGRLIDQTGGNP